MLSRLPALVNLRWFKIIQNLAEGWFFPFENTWLPFSMLRKDKNIILKHPAGPQSWKSGRRFWILFQKWRKKKTSDIWFVGWIRRKVQSPGIIGLERGFQILRSTKGRSNSLKVLFLPYWADYVEKDLISLLWWKKNLGYFSFIF